MLRFTFYLLLILFIPRTYSQDDNLKIISWNIRDFGRTKDANEIKLIADIIKDADVVAIQEVVAGFGGPQAVARLCKELEARGEVWDYAISEGTISPKYMTERYAFLWKTEKINAKDRGRLISELNERVDREPFFMEFEMDDLRFGVLNYHSGHNEKNPEIEIKAITQYVDNAFKHPHFILGDFNASEDSPSMDELSLTGYVPVLVRQKTTLKRFCKGNKYLNAETDNIFYSQNVKIISGGVIDYVKHCERLPTALKISDHLPIYLDLELQID